MRFLRSMPTPPFFLFSLSFPPLFVFFFSFFFFITFFDIFFFYFFSHFFLSFSFFLFVIPTLLFSYQVLNTAQILSESSPPRHSAGTRMVLQSTNERFLRYMLLQHTFQTSHKTRFPCNILFYSKFLFFDCYF